MIKTAYKYIIALLLSMIFTVIFFKSDELADGIFTAKMFYFYFAAVIIIAALIPYYIGTIYKKDISLKISALDAAVLFFYVYSFIRLLTTQTSLYNDRFFCFTLLLIFYFSFKKVFKSGIFTNTVSPGYIILFIFLSAGFLQSLIGLFQTYGILGFTHVQFLATGSYDNPAPYAQFIGAVLPFAFGISQFYAGDIFLNRLLKKYAFLTFLTCLLVLPSTATRGAWAASAAGVIFILAVKYELVKKLSIYLNSKAKRLIAAIGIGAFICGLLIGLYYIRPASAYGRLLIWKVSANIIAGHPFFGAGYDSFSANYNNYQAAYFAEKDRNDFEIYVTDDVKEAHSDFIEIAVELGFLGLLLFTAILFISLKQPQSEAENQPLARAAQASIISIAISAIFTYPYQILPTFIIFMFMLSLVSSNIDKNVFIIPDFRFGRILGYASIFAAAIFLALFARYEIGNFNAYIAWGKGRMNSSWCVYDEAIKQYKAAYPYLKQNGNYLLNYGGTLSLMGKHKEAIVLLKESEKYNSESNIYLSLGRSYEALNEFNLAEAAYKKASFMVPNLFYPKYKLAKLYAKAGRNNDAILLAEEIINTEPKIASMAIEEMKIEMKGIIKNTVSNSKK